jgi:prepilin-type N-terminal cleavage/methylation domain-containing protein
MKRQTSDCARKRTRCGVGHQGFSMVELIVSIFILAVVIGTGMVIIAANLNLMQKSNEMMVAAALAQYQAEIVRNIEFPPVYHDRQSWFPAKVDDAQALPSIPSPDPSFIVRTGSVWYGADGQANLTATDTDRVMMRKVKIEVRRRRDFSLLYYLPVFIPRNGLY